jgi:peptide/nickel transport system permease protein
VLIAYLVRRLLWAMAVLAAVAVVTYLLIYFLPADPARLLAGGARARPDDVARISAVLGLDRPLHEQFAHYVGRLLTGDLGISFSARRPVAELIAQRFPATLELALAGIAIQLMVGIPLGVISATRRGRWPDRVITIFSSVTIAAPPFWVGYLLLFGLAFLPALHGFRLFEIGGYRPLDPRYLFLPALTLGLAGTAYYVRMMRAALLEELNRMYVLAARARGLSERRVVWRHAGRNALGPLTTQFGLDIGFFLGGVVVIEYVFSWPGIGKLAVDAIRQVDIPVVIGTVMFGTLTIVVANVMVDLVYAFLDPRVRASRR